MEALKNKILSEGRVLPGNILKVDSFLNHQMDPRLMQAIGHAFAERFKDCHITKIITIEASGIAPAIMTGLALDVPVLFAKKTLAANMDADSYMTTVHSYTRHLDYTIIISRRYLSETDRVLIIDDFLANGQAVLGLEELIGQSGATLAGAGIVIEKEFQEGGQRLRKMGIRVESLAIIREMSNGQISFA